MNDDIPWDPEARERILKQLRLRRGVAVMDNGYDLPADSGPASKKSSAGRSPSPPTPPGAFPPGRNTKGS